MSFPVVLGCFKALGDKVPLQLIHAAYPDAQRDDGGWLYSKTAAEKIENLIKRGLATVDQSKPLFVATIDWSLINMMATASGEKLALDNAELEAWAKTAAEGFEAQAAEQQADIAETPLEPTFDPKQEAELVQSWQQSGNKEHLSSLLKRYEPLIKKHSARYYGADLPRAAIDAEAKMVAMEAFKNYDPKRGVQLSTYVSSYLPKTRRFVINHQNAVRLPEGLALRIGAYQNANQELTTNLGRSPNAQELADHQGWSIKDVRKIRLSTGGAQIQELNDFVPGVANEARRAEIFVDYLYHELDGDQKKVLEHLYGLHGAEKLDTAEAIAQASGMAPARVEKLRGQIAGKMREHLDQV